MLSIIAALLVAGCTTEILPRAEMYAAQLGKPDAHSTATCGGGENQYGKITRKWRCLKWTYEGKGKVWFQSLTDVPENHYRVTGCFTGTPRIVAEQGPVWVLHSCDDVNHKEKPCNTIGFGIEETEDFKLVPNIEDEFGKSPSEEWMAWRANQPKLCTTLAEAKQAAASCKVTPPPPARPAEPAEKPAGGSVEKPAPGEAASI